MKKTMYKQLWVMSLVAIGLATLTTTQSSGQENVPTFRAETIDSKVMIGYGVAIGDVDGDKKPDIILADKQQFVWYQNPSWKRHVIAENLTEKDNVCIAARDINGDGKVEIAVGGQWNPGDTVNSGSVHYLVAPNDRTQKWTPIKLHHEPVVHRMRWLKSAGNDSFLIVAPLHGRGNQGGEGKGVRLLAYQVPADPNDEWRTQVLDDEMHVTHNFDIAKWDENDRFDSVIYYGKEGAKLIQPRLPVESNKSIDWQKQVLNNVKGGGEIRLGSNGGRRFLATIEPFHGTDLVYYSQSSDESGFDNRVVLANDFNQGHAIAVANLFGNGKQQIVAGWRKPNKQDREMGVKLFYSTDANDTQWKSVFIDKNEMACEDLRVADLNNDGRPEIIASGRSTHNLKVYWNEASKRPLK